MARRITIDEEQAQLLERRARELGVGEDELVRWLLDDALRPAAADSAEPERPSTVQELLAAADEIAATHRLPPEYEFNREELYAEREARWLKP